MSRQMPYDRVVSLIPFLADRLRELRKRHELTQDEFARAAGFSFKFYQQLESGRKKQVWLETVERAAATYGVGVHELLSPECPVTELKCSPPASNVHYRSRKGPYKKKPAG